MRQIVVEALRAAGIDTPGVEAIVSRALNETTRDWIVLSYVAKVGRRLLNSHSDTNPRQGWLALPEYADVPTEVADDSLQQLRDRIRILKRRIRSYGYVRRTEKKLKADKQKLHALEKMEKNIAPYFAGRLHMTVTKAVLMHRESLQTPIAGRNRALAKKGALARWARTKNQ